MNGGGSAELANMGAVERIAFHAPDIAVLLAFLLLTVVASKLVFAAFSLGIREKRVLAVVVLAQLAVLPPRVMVYAVFAYGILWPMSLPVAIACASIVFAMMALVEYQLYEKGRVTDNPLMLAIVLNVGYLLTLVAFVLFSGAGFF